jgi:carbon storage regulator
MLVLSRKLNESIMIGDQIEIVVLDVREGSVRLGIKAPRDVSIHRQEVYAEIRQQNALAAQPESLNLSSTTQRLKSAASIFKTTGSPEKSSIRFKKNSSDKNTPDSPSAADASP